MDVDQLYDTRNLGVTVFRAGLVSVLLVALATLYLSSISSTSAAYGGALMLLIPLLTVAASLVVYVPAARLMRSAAGVPVKSIFTHQYPASSAIRNGEQDFFEHLERDLL